MRAPESNFTFDPIPSNLEFYYIAGDDFFLPDQKPSNVSRPCPFEVSMRVPFEYERILDAKSGKFINNTRILFGLRLKNAFP